MAIARRACCAVAGLGLVFGMAACSSSSAGTASSSSAGTASSSSAGTAGYQAQFEKLWHV